MDNEETNEEPSYMYHGIDLTNVHGEYQRYKPEDIAEINDIDVLYELIDLYSPASQPWDDEYHYLRLMLDALTDRLQVLKQPCPPWSC